MVDREANNKTATDRGNVCSVYYNRLKINMTLGVDATLLYALGRLTPEPTFAELQLDSPYNTRTESGLPPGPICSPGLDSIKAVVNPAPTNYQFFVAKPDGSHAFAETFQEHLENIQRYGGDPGTPP